MDGDLTAFEDTRTTATLRELAQDAADRLAYAEAAQLERLAIARYPRGSGGLRQRDVAMMVALAAQWEHAARDAEAEAERLADTIARVRALTRRPAGRLSAGGPGVFERDGRHHVSAWSCAFQLCAWKNRAGRARRACADARGRARSSARPR